MIGNGAFGMGVMMDEEEFSRMMEGMSPEDMATLMRLMLKMSKCARKRKMVTNIAFEANGRMTETQFDTTDEDELAHLWWEFCKENHLIEVESREAEDYE